MTNAQGSIEFQALVAYLCKHASFEFEALPENTEVKGNASAIDDDTDAYIERSIQNRLDNGDLSAWFTAKVTAHFAGIEASDYLGCCSYLNFDEFKSDAYFADMKKEAASQLAVQMTLIDVNLALIRRQIAEASIAQ